MILGVRERRKNQILVRQVKKAQRLWQVLRYYKLYRIDDDDSSIAKLRASETLRFLNTLTVNHLGQLCYL